MVSLPLNVDLDKLKHPVGENHGVRGNKWLLELVEVAPVELVEVSPVAVVDPGGGHS